MSTDLVQEKTIVSHKEWIQNPVLFYGPRKAGTTLLQNLFDGGNNLLMRQGELKLKHFINEIWPSEKHATKRYYRKKRDIGIRREGKTFRNFDHEPFMEEIHKNLRNNTSLKDLIVDEIELIYDCIQDKPSDLKYWGVKEAGGDIHKIIQLWKQHFFNGKAIFIFRDPLMIVRSILTQARRKNESMSFRRIHKEVKTALYSMKKMEQYIHKDYVYALTYESLTDNTEKQVAGVCSFLGIENEPKLHYPTKFSVIEKVGNASKNTHKVFSSNKKWYTDLSLKEQLVVGFFYTIYKTKIDFNYSQIVEKIQNQE